MIALTALEAKLRAISPELEDVIAVLRVVQGATGLGGQAAQTGLDIAGAAVQALEDHAAGAITHDQLLAQIAQAHADTAADRAAEDAAP